MNTESTQINTNIEQIDVTSRSNNSTLLSDTISNQKKYFTMYVTNKSAEMAKKFENEIENIVTNSLTNEINKIVTQHINAINSKFNSKIDEIKEQVKSELLFEKEKLDAINLKLEKLQLSFYKDASEYINDTINNTIQNCINNTSKKNSNVGDNIELDHQDLLLNDRANNIITEEKIIIEMTNLLQKIDQLKMDIHKITKKQQLEDKINVNLKKSSVIPIKELSELSESSLLCFTMKPIRKFSNICSCLTNNVLENINLSLRVNKYSALLLSSMAIVIIVSQAI